MTISETVILNLKNLGLSNEQFYQLCQINENWRLEQTAQGELLIMPPVGAISGNREAEFNADLVIWNRQTQLGKVFSSSTIFILPNGGKRSPDVAWIANDRWQALTPEEQEKFAPICPDFVIQYLLKVLLNSFSLFLIPGYLFLIKWHYPELKSLKTKQNSLENY